MSIQLKLPFPPEEIWKDIPGYEGVYQVSSNGRVFNVLRHRMLKLGRNSGGYMRVWLFKDGVGKSAVVHRLVMLTFEGECPDGLEVNHLDGNPENNRYSNLEYCTHRQNIMHSLYTLGRGVRAKETFQNLPISNRTNLNNAILTVDDVKEIRRLYATGDYTQSALGLRFGVAQSVVYYIVKRKTWRHVV